MTQNELFEVYLCWGMNLMEIFLVYAMANVARDGFGVFYTSGKNCGLQKVNLGSKEGQFR